MVNGKSNKTKEKPHLHYLVQAASLSDVITLVVRSLLNNPYKHECHDNTGLSIIFLTDPFWRQNNCKTVL